MVLAPVGRQETNPCKNLTVRCLESLRLPRVLPLRASEPRPTGPGQRLAGTEPEARIGTGVLPAGAGNYDCAPRFGRLLASYCPLSGQQLGQGNSSPVIGQM
jgi:hypothetical protein